MCVLFILLLIFVDIVLYFKWWRDEAREMETKTHVIRMCEKKKYNAFSIIHQSDFLNGIFLFIILFDWVCVCVCALCIYTHNTTAFCWHILLRYSIWVACLVICFGFRTRARLLPIHFFFILFTFSITTVWHISRYLTHLCTYKYCLRAWEHFSHSLARSLTLFRIKGDSNSSLSSFTFNFHLFTNFPCFCLSSVTFFLSFISFCRLLLFIRSFIHSFLFLFNICIYMYVCVFVRMS